MFVVAIDLVWFYARHLWGETAVNLTAVSHAGTASIYPPSAYFISDRPLHFSNLSQHLHSEVLSSIFNEQNIMLLFFK